jgi:hypothetical protein
MVLGARSTQSIRRAMAMSDLLRLPILFGPKVQLIDGFGDFGEFLQPAELGPPAQQRVPGVSEHEFFFRGLVSQASDPFVGLAKESGLIVLRLFLDPDDSADGLTLGLINWYDIGDLNHWPVFWIVRFHKIVLQKTRLASRIVPRD